MIVWSRQQVMKMFLLQFWKNLWIFPMIHQGVKCKVKLSLIREMIKTNSVLSMSVDQLSVLMSIQLSRSNILSVSLAILSFFLGGSFVIYCNFQYYLKIEYCIRKYDSQFDLMIMVGVFIDAQYIEIEFYFHFLSCTQFLSER